MADGESKTPGSGLDTGTGGFPVGASASRQTYDVGSNVGDSPSEAWSPGQVSVDKSVRDLSKGTRRTLASYLSDTTLGRSPSSPTPIPNKYPIVHDPAADPTQLSHLDAKGYPTPIAGVSADQPHFSDLGPGRSIDSVDLNILRGTQEPVPSTDPRLDKTKNGNVLLPSSTTPAPGAATPPEAGSVNVSSLDVGSPVKYYTERLTSKNEYGAGSEYLEPGTSIPLRRPTALDDTPVGTLGPQDLPPARLKTMSDYLGRITKDGPAPMRGNVYPVDATPVRTESLLDDGLPRPPHPSPNTAKFVSDFVLSSRSSAASNLKDFSRGRSPDRSKVDGNDLLLNATGELQARSPANPSAQGGVFTPPVGTVPTEAVVSQQIRDYYGDVGDISKSVIYNRFNPTSTYTSATDPDGTPKARLNQPQFALKYKPGQSYGPNDPARDVSYGRLAQIGNALSLKASSELNSATDGNNPTGGAAQSSAIAPGAAQLGGNINPNELTAKSILESLVKEGIDENILIDPSGRSWGSLNNVHDQYAGLSSFGMQLLSAALVTAVSTAVSTFSMITSLPTTVPIKEDSVGRRPYGASFADPAAGYTSSIGTALVTNIYRLLGIQPTLYKLDDCIVKGTLAFFEGGNTTRGTAASATANTSANTGYYVVISRVVTRSFVLIGGAFSDLGKAFGSGFVSGVKKLIDIIGVLRDSKFLRMINVFAQLGDRILAAAASPEGMVFDPDSIGFGRRHLTTFDGLNSSVHARSRLSDENQSTSTSLSWSSYRSPDMLIRPAVLRHPSFLDKLDSPNHSLGISTTGQKGSGLKRDIYTSDEMGRISTLDREEMEKSLESEYVPFYLHDVRTNEILSFHAFLASLTDDYTANYDSSDGFGRVESIKIYKSTNRRIGFSFYIVATNPNDFDVMWTKINKLTTMVYPQFTEGRTLVDEKNKFYMPFSQTIQAAPLIRLRIGDLIRSNYSKFNLARLFGYSYANTKFNDEIFSPDSKKPTEEDLNNLRYLPDNTFFPSVPVSGDRLELSQPELKLKTKSPKASFGFSSQLKIDETLSSAPSKDPPPPKTFFNVELPRSVALKLLEYDSATKSAKCSIVWTSDEDLLFVPEEVRDAWKYQPLNNLGGHTIDAIVGSIITISVDKLEGTPSTKRKFFNELKRTYPAPNDYVQAASDFMIDDPKDRDKGNAVVRSFRSSGGKGLAGFIESMNFDWYDKVTWETETGKSRAPKMCKVTISFAPVHDISPGLDHMGDNRAPIYPVGPLSPRDK